MSESIAASRTTARNGCIADREHCGGVDDDLPCFACYNHYYCPSGRRWCAARGGADETDTLCRECAIRRGVLGTAY